MRFGICTSLANADSVRSTEWDFLEIQAKELLDERPVSSSFPVLAANVLVPASLKITGPDADLARLRDHMEKVARRAEDVGIQTLVFGSGGARHVPEGFDRDRAAQQILDFARMAAE